MDSVIGKLKINHAIISLPNTNTKHPIIFIIEYTDVKLKEFGKAINNLIQLKKIATLK